MARQLLNDRHGHMVTFCRLSSGMPCLHAPGEMHCRECWPPRGRGRGEERYSPRRIEAMFRAMEAMKLWGSPISAPKWMGGNRMTLEEIARRLGYKDKSGAWRAIRRLHEYTLMYDQMHSRPYHDE